jgi:hypothetical protein
MTLSPSSFTLRMVQPAPAERQLHLPIVLPHHPLLPRCVSGIAPVGVAQFVVAAAPPVGSVAAMSAVNTSLIAAARRQTLTRR